MFGYTGQDVDRLIAKGKYPKAAKILRGMLAERPGNIQLRQKLADTLALCGENQAAAKILESLVREFAADGFHAKAIAIVKKIQRIEPGRGDLDVKLARVVEKREVRTPPAPPPPAQPSPDAPTFDYDEPLPEPGIGDVDYDYDEETVAEAEFPEDLADMADLDDTAEIQAVQESPLFNGFSADDLGALIGGLNLRTFEPGEIVISEGAPGSSLLLVASGMVRVFVRNDLGHHVQIRKMGAGEFFGEISILTGHPRTATIIAAEPLEILELGQVTLERIGEKHPRVPEIIRDFCEQRASSPEEISARRDIELPL